MTLTIAIVLLIIVVAGIVVVVAAFGRRPQSRPRSGWWFTREQNIKQAAAEDVRALRKDAKDVSPDAPGNHFDDL
jgi:hypothetical protein